MSNKLKLFRIKGELEDLDRVMEVFVNLPCLHPILAKEVISHTHGLASVASDNPWSEIISELSDIETDFGISIKVKNTTSIVDSLSKVREYVHSTHEKLKKLNNHKIEAENLIRRYSDALTQVKNINSLDISLDDIFSCEYVSTRFGKLPIDSFEVLKLYRSKPFMLQMFGEEKNYYWCMYLTTDKHEREIDNIFSSLFFERIYIPDYIHGTPEEAIKALSTEIEIVQTSLKEIKLEISTLINADFDKLSIIKGEMKLLEKMYDSRRYVVSLGEKFIITGYIHDKNTETIINRFKESTLAEVDIMPANMDLRFKPPKKLKEKCN